MYWYEHRSKKKKIILKNFFLIWWIIPFLEKLWTTCENIEIVNLSKQEEEEIFYRTSFSNRNEKFL